MAAGSEDRTIRVWDLATGQSIATLEGHSARVWSVAFSPDGTRLASGSSDQTIRLWHTLARDGLGSSTTLPQVLASLYRVSLDKLRFRLQEIGFVRRPNPIVPIALSPINGYVFPQPRPLPRALDRPSPPGKDLVEWLLENADEPAGE